MCARKLTCQNIISNSLARLRSGNFLFLLDQNTNWIPDTIAHYFDFILTDIAYS